jgi:hypothetical protein
MWSRPLFCAFVWFTLLLPLTATAQAPTDDKAPQTANSATGIPTFYANSRQVIVEAKVWDKGRKKGDDSDIDPSLPPGERALLKRLPPPAQGLTPQDFQVFDNGIEQKINYFKETDFPVVDISNQWGFFPTIGGTWGELQLNGVVEGPSSAYLIGYAAPAIQPGECRSINIIVKGRDVQSNRDRYCAPSSSDVHEDNALLGTKLSERMRQFANSQERGSIKTAAQAFTFWSSGVLHLATEPSPPTPGTALTPDDYTYVVEVRDAKAPATVQITAAFDVPGPAGMWYFPCRKDEVIYIMGLVYKANGEIAGQFTDSFSCWNVVALWPKGYRPTGYGPEPSMFDGQIDLAPGHYSLKIVISDGSNFGRAQIPLNVEPLNPHDLMISDVMVVSVLRKASWVLREAAAISPSPVMPTPLVSKGAQFFPDPDARPLVPQHSPLCLYFEIYQPAQEKTDAAIYYRVKITDLKTGTVVMNTEPMSAADWIVPGNPVIPIGLKVATEKLQKGSYRLEIQATDSAGRQTDWRQANFTIQ